MVVDSRLARVLAAVLGLDPAAVDSDATAESIPTWDSVAHIQLIMALEDEYGMQFDPGEIGDLVSVKAIMHRLAGSQ